MNGIVCAPPAEVGPLAASHVGSALGEAIARRGRAVLALPGGSAIDAVAGPLASAAVDWSRLWLLWVDERAVGPDDNDSNYRRALPLIAGTTIPVDHVLRPPGEGRPLRRAAERYAAQVDSLIARGPIDVALLGVGADGHVASLFPGHRSLEVTDRTVVAVHDAPKPPRERLTLTLPVLASAGLVVVVAMGEEKASALRSALDARRLALNDPSTTPVDTGGLPIARVLARAPRVVVVVDDALGGAIGG